MTTPARTLLDLSAVVKPHELATAIDRAERLGLLDLTALTELLDRANGRRGARALREANAAYEPGTQKSELECRFKALLETAADIPTPAFNAAVSGEHATHKVDAFWPTSAWRSSSTASNSTAPVATASATPPPTPISSWRGSA